MSKSKTEASQLLDWNVNRLVGHWRDKYKSQAELAKAMGIDPSSLSRMLSGNPKLSTIANIAKALQVPIAELFKGESVPPLSSGVDGYVLIDGRIEHITSKDDMLRLGKKDSQDNQSPSDYITV